MKKRTIKSIFQLSFLGIMLAVMPVNAKTVKVGMDAEPESLDIHSFLTAGIMQLATIVFDPLIRFKSDFSFEYRLAESVEQIDAKTLRVTLRKGVTFHSGNPFTADDVVWTINRLKVSTDFKGLFSPISEVKKIDDHTIDLITEEPYALTKNLLTYVFPMDSKFYTGTDENGRDKSVIDKTVTTFADTNASGTGAFKFVSHEPGVKMEFVRNENYWDKATQSYADGLILIAIKENSTRVAALLSNDVDMIMPVAPTEHDRIKKHKDVNLVTLSGTRVITFQLNQETSEPLRDKRVRQAITYAVNNTGIVDKVMRGFATVASQQSAAGYLGHVEDLKPRYDLDKAKALMKEAGYADGFTLSMIAPNDRYINDEKIAQTVSAMLARINIKVNLRTMPKAQYWPEFYKCEADLSMVGWHSDTEDSANFTEYLTMTRNEETGKGSWNCGHYSNEKVDNLIIQSNAELDVEKRKAMLQEVERLLYEDAAFLPLHFQDLSWAAHNSLDIKPILNAQSQPWFGHLQIKE